uniref:Uncharacterized protein n=1 Tax=Chromera velia CCMP2878 TaxID=1169474 RepID=A0A0G4GWD1_9ALVE|eukprot:Cvel_23592.t1-p1 / transcript=Cvel_23592.t1 / gene=Cvel_23592 / organism=Chromera_velia_CCMP2878 / gene_product=hypothetical protein / transcript_product=hypothetical protein / location=Cvel_scaffold2450:3557-5970(-) / protein_length=268 / sequence_SO=supercontig / SO=protein_coding / is_pseudo=false
MKWSAFVFCFLFVFLSVVVRSSGQEEEEDYDPNDAGDGFSPLYPPEEEEVPAGGRPPTQMTEEEIAAEELVLDAHDEGKTEAEKTDSMKACLAMTRVHVHKTLPGLEEMIKQMVESGMERSDVENLLATNMLTTCYFNMDTESAKKALAKGLDQEATDKIMTPNAESQTKYRRLSRKQSQLLQKVVEAESREAGPGAGDPMGGMGVGLPFASFPPWAKALWALGVIGIFFGLSILGLRRLMHMTDDGLKAPKKTKASKAEKREAKKKA